MRINAKALLRVGGVDCLHEEGGLVRRARVALVTEETVRAARALGEADPSLRATETSPQLRYGGALAYLETGPEGSARLELGPGEGDGFRLRDGLRFLGRNMCAAERALAAAPHGGASPLLEAIRSVLTLVSAVPDPHRFPEHLISQAYRFTLRSVFGEARMPIGEEGQALRARADLVRSRIGEIDPASPDALRAATPLPLLLDRIGLDVRAEGVRVAGFGRLPRAEVRRLVQSAPYRDGLFGVLTRTPPDRVEGVALTLQEASVLDEALSGRRITGAWAEAISALGRGLTRSGLFGYQLDLTVYAAEGRDLLLMSDTVGREGGVALLFSWPTHERVPVLRAPGGDVYATGPEETPGPAEVIRLERALSALIEERAAAQPARQTLDA